MQSESVSLPGQPSADFRWTFRETAKTKEDKYADRGSIRTGLSCTDDLLIQRSEIGSDNCRFPCHVTLLTTSSEGFLWLVFGFIRWIGMPSSQLHRRRVFCLVFRLFSRLITWYILKSLIHTSSLCTLLGSRPLLYDIHCDIVQSFFWGRYDS
ncbi:hypothetical protein GYMLUDRAFT_875690 [Collybiopsis luxurians FD-317 M1]|nr:hypothetical protein GYMLUDRAFT_875690 [Collybiopsis luxurians FD-317 M1]